MLGYRPLVYFWIAEYNDGSALPQFDPETGRENKFSDVDQQKLKRFGWHPFTPELAKKIEESEKIVVVSTRNPPYAITLEKGVRLIAHRTNKIKLQPRRDGVNRRETFYVLGVEGGKILQIDEGGKVVNDSR
jgi:hypothetical protein